MPDPWSYYLSREPIFYALLECGNNVGSHEMRTHETQTPFFLVRVHIHPLCTFQALSPLSHYLHDQYVFSSVFLPTSTILVLQMIDYLSNYIHVDQPLL